MSTRSRQESRSPTASKANAPARHGRPRSLVLVNTGDGKGKSTAAFGVVMRAVARGWRVCVVQFIKSDKWKVGEEGVARQLGVRFIFVEKEDGKLALRRGFKISPGEKILVVEDVVTQGSRVSESIGIIRANAGQVVGVAMAVDRSGGAVSFGVPTYSLLSLKVETFEPGKLPPELAALRPVKPGSK